MAKKNKKQATEGEVEPELNTNNDDSDDSHNKKKLKKKNKKMKIPTVSIAVPGSIIDNVPTLELATRLAGQIARAATIFRINEVVVFDNKSNPDNDSVLDNSNDESGASFLMQILQYLETPQYLRKALFPMHNSLRFVGLLPPLDAPHHLRKHEWGPYREGVTVKERHLNSGATLVDVGLVKNVIVDQIFKPGRRVTVAMGTDRNLDSVPYFSDCANLTVVLIVIMSYPSSCNALPSHRGYDFIIGTSEHGQIIKSSDLEIPSFRYCVITSAAK
uniref:Uncharacterized protein n=1 Tax=Glycine max TaxID=3847 RepID=A0A0R0I6M2_SOYBN